MRYIMKSIMKSIIILFVFCMSQNLYSLEIYRMDSLNFGEVVKGDRRVTLDGIRVYVKGKGSKTVILDIPEEINTSAGRVRIIPRERTIRLNNRGRGYFILRCEIKPTYSRYGRIDDSIDVKVSYK